MRAPQLLALVHGLWSASALAGLVLTQGPPSPAATTPYDALLPRSTGSPAPANSACAAAANASSQYFADNPDASVAVIAADVAYNCLVSIPNRQEPAIRLLNSLRTYLEFQSTKEWLRDPPAGYLFPALDLDAEFDGIQKKVEAGGYDSEYDMQEDLHSLLVSARDQHLEWSGDLYNSFAFGRTVHLSSVSSDGVQPPQVYVTSDLVDLTADGWVPVTGYTPSPVQSIDGVDAVSFLLNQALIAKAQDPDAQWNQLFFSLGSAADPTFTVPVSYSGASTNLTFANGTTVEYQNRAIVIVALDGVVTADDAYTALCPGAVQTALAVPTATESSATASPSATATEAPPTSPTVPGFPYPVIKHSADSVAGYYLNATGLTDVAVLQVREFVSETAISPEYKREFQLVVQKFLDASVRTGKRKLIIDLQGNGGGFIDLGTDLFTQLFPSIQPNVKSNMRDHLGLWILGNAASDNVTAAGMTANGSAVAVNDFLPVAYQTVVSEQFDDFPDFDSFFGPYPAHGGNWTAFFQLNYTDPIVTDFAGEGIIITGTNNRTGFRQPFAAQDMVVLTDGYCGSTCTILSEYLKNYARVQFVTVGGRPQTGPMQAVGGTKGSQVFSFEDIFLPAWVDLFQSSGNAFLGEANGTIWENFTSEPVLREIGLEGGGVNGRNNFRVGDESNTPLQFVYEAADCRIWWTREMLYDATALWNRVATIAFRERQGTQFNSKYCVANSTGHATSISGGWKAGTLGPQTPPDNAYSSTTGWKLDGKPLPALSPGGRASNLPWVGKEKGVGMTEEAVAKSIDNDGGALASIKEACTSYTGDAWLARLMCQALNG